MYIQCSLWMLAATNLWSAILMNLLRNLSEQMLGKIYPISTQFATWGEIWKSCNSCHSSEWLQKSGICPVDDSAFSDSAFSSSFLAICNNHDKPDNPKHDFKINSLSCSSPSVDSAIDSDKIPVSEIFPIPSATPNHKILTSHATVLTSSPYKV